MKKFLDEHHSGRPTHHLTPHRLARVQVVVRDDKTNNLFELVVDLDASEVTKKEFLVGKHDYIDPNYMKLVEHACLKDSRVQDEIGRLDLPAGSCVCVEPWAYATDGEGDMTKRRTMVSIPSRGDPTDKS